MYNLYDVIIQPNEALPSNMYTGAGLPAGAPSLLDYDNYQINFHQELKIRTANFYFDQLGNK